MVCVDEKPKSGPWPWTAPILPLRPGLPEKATHDDVRVIFQPVGLPASGQDGHDVSARLTSPCDLRAAQGP